MAIPPFGSPPGITQAKADLRYVKKAGDTMTGDLVITPTSNDLSTLKVNQAGGTTDVLTVDTTDSQTIMRGINDVATAGANQLASNAFNNATFWTLGAGWTGAASSVTGATASSSVVATATNFAAAVVGTTYQIAFRTTVVTAGTFTLNLGGATSIPIAVNSGFGAVLSLTAVSTAGFSIVGTGFTGTIQSITIKAMTNSNPIAKLNNASGTTVTEFRGGGTNNQGIGVGALQNLQSGTNNYAAGAKAAQFLATGSNNVALGFNALGNTVTNGINVAIGANALSSFFPSGNAGNVAIGANAVQALQIGGNNTVVGGSSLNNAVSGSNNTVIGGGSGTGITTGGSNLIVGSASGNQITTGTGNVIIGNAIGPASNVSNTLNVGNVYTGNTSTQAATTKNNTLDDGSGNATVNGNLTLGVAGNKLNVTTGTNASAGTGTLTGGTVNIATTVVTANSLIFLTDTTASLTNVGTLSVTSKTAGTGFTVTSSNALDTSTFNWLVIN